MTEQSWPTVPTGDPPVYPDGGVELNIGRHRTMFADRTGVVGYPGSTDRSVYADGSGLQVKRRAGARWIQGIYGTDGAEKSLTVADPHTSLWRIDRVVDRLTADGVIKTFVKTGTAAATPSAPTLTQVAGGTWEESLATFGVAPNAVSVTSTDAAVTDERRFMPVRVTPVSSEALRPASPLVGDEADFVNGRRDRWTGSAWARVRGAAYIKTSHPVSVALTVDVIASPPATTIEQLAGEVDGDGVSLIARTPGVYQAVHSFVIADGNLTPEFVPVRYFWFLNDANVQSGGVVAFAYAGLGGFGPLVWTGQMAAGDRLRLAVQPMTGPVTLRPNDGHVASLTLIGRT